jgi:hypothetical protein
MEVTVNVQAFEELQRVLSSVPGWEFNIARWHECACGHATRDAWFQRQGFTTCYSFVDAAAFFGISRKEAIWLFSGQAWVVSTQDVIQRIDALLAKHAISSEAAKHARRQAVIDDLLARATKAAQKAKTAATSLVAMFF